MLSCARPTSSGWRPVSGTWLGEAQPSSLRQARDRPEASGKPAQPSSRPTLAPGEPPRGRRPIQPELRAGRVGDQRGRRDRWPLFVGHQRRDARPQRDAPALQTTRRAREALRDREGPAGSATGGRAQAGEDPRSGLLQPGGAPSRRAARTRICQDRRPADGSSTIVAAFASLVVVVTRFTDDSTLRRLSGVTPNHRALIEALDLPPIEQYAILSC